MNLKGRIRHALARGEPLPQWLGQHENPSKRAWRKLKRVAGHRQARRLTRRSYTLKGRAEGEKA